MHTPVLSRVRRLVLATSLGFLLACAGVIDSMAPAPVVPPPAGSTTTSFNSSFNNGTSSVTMEYSTSASASEITAHYEASLAADGWTVVGSSTGGMGVVTATKGAESFSVTTSDGSFTTVWVK
ncbi:MAG: hypothetical protein R3F61_25465 [Myxococcota bacterium]